MTKSFTRIIAATLTATLIGLSAAPAMADGQISFGFSPRDRQHAEALGLGLQVYSLVRGFSGKGVDVRQNGRNNSAGGSQNGAGNYGVVYQDGNNHQGTIEQRGNRNNCGLFQFGRNTNASCMQNGNGNTTITTVYGF